MSDCAHDVSEQSLIIKRRNFVIRSLHGLRRHGNELTDAAQWSGKLRERERETETDGDGGGGGDCCWSSEEM